MMMFVTGAPVGTPGWAESPKRPIFRRLTGPGDQEVGRSRLGEGHSYWAIPQAAGTRDGVAGGGGHRDRTKAVRSVNSDADSLAVSRWISPASCSFGKRAQDEESRAAGLVTSGSRPRDCRPTRDNREDRGRVRRGFPSADSSMAARPTGGPSLRWRGWRWPASRRRDSRD